VTDVVYRVGYLERMPLGTPYPSIVARVGSLLGRLPGAELVIDYTGVGRPVFDMFRISGISPIGVLITGGATETHEGFIHGVPKLTLISRLQVLLHEGRLKIHKDLSEAETLVRELQDFRCEFTAAGALTFNARSGRHDDLLLALAIAVWRAADGGMTNAGLFRYYEQQYLKLVGGSSKPRDVVGVEEVIRAIEVNGSSSSRGTELLQVDDLRAFHVERLQFRRCDELAALEYTYTSGY
jgi:hypothetical protein